MLSRRILEILLLPLLLLAGSATALSQDRWDGILDRYEAICDRCIDLRERIAAGASVPDRSVTSLLQELNSLRKTLQDASGSMSAKQRTRFRDIQRKYAAASGGAETARAERSAPAASATRSGTPSAPKTAKAAPTPDSPTVVRESLRVPRLAMPFAQSPIPFPEGVTIQLANRSISAISLPQEASSPSRQFLLSCDILALYGHGTASSFGLMAAVGIGSRWGLWAAGRSNFVGTGSAYDCQSDGTTGSGRFWGNGNSRFGTFTVSGGPLWRPLPWLGIFAGAGYAKEELDWQDMNEDWARVEDFSFTGPVFDAGLLFSWRRLSLSLGCSWSNYATLTLGAGVHF